MKVVTKATEVEIGSCFDITSPSLRTTCCSPVVAGCCEAVYGECVQHGLSSVSESFGERDCMMRWEKRVP